MSPRDRTVEDRRRLLRRREENWRGERPWPAGALPKGVKNEEEMFHHAKPTIALRLVRHEALLAVAGIIGIVLLALFVLPIAMNTVGTIPAILTVLFLVVFIAFATTPVWMAALVDDYEDHGDEFTDDESRNAP